MNTESDNDTPKTTIIYYGKKVYCVDPSIARKKLTEGVAKCRYEDIEDKYEVSR